MKKTQLGSPDGITVIKYEAGEIYDIPESLYDVFNDQLGIVDLIPKEIPKAAIDERNKAVMEGPLENKEEKPKKTGSKK
jgi:hypothetical protein